MKSKIAKSPLLSLCMIAKDEASILKSAVDSVKDIVDEIIIVDTGSNDNTKEVAKSFTPRVFDYDWNDDFSDARNFCMKRASGQWILFLDADETISKKDHKKILEFINSKKANAFYLLQRTYTKDPLTPYITSLKNDTKDSKSCFGRKG